MFFWLCSLSLLCCWHDILVFQKQVTFLKMMHKVTLGWGEVGAMRASEDHLSPTERTVFLGCSSATHNHSCLRHPSSLGPTHKLGSVSQQIFRICDTLSLFSLVLLLFLIFHMALKLLLFNTKKILLRSLKNRSWF